MAYIELMLSNYLCNISEIYEKKERFAGGANGEVYKADRKKDKYEVALKIFSEDILKNIYNEKHFMRELNLLASIDHPFCLKLVNFSFNPPIIATPLMTGGTLDDFLNGTKETFDPTQKMCTIYAICSTMAALHYRGIIHRDFKPANIFLQLNDDLYDICIADFGSARKIDINKDLTKQPEGTPLHQALECFTGEEYTSSADVYSFGVTFYQYFSHEPKFENGKNPTTTFGFMDLINKGYRFAQPPNMTNEQMIVYTECTNHNNFDRPTFQDLANKFEMYEILWMTGTDKVKYLNYVKKCKMIYEKYIQMHKDDVPITNDDILSPFKMCNLTRSLRIKSSQSVTRPSAISSHSAPSSTKLSKKRRKYDV